MFVGLDVESSLIAEVEQNKFVYAGWFDHIFVTHFKNAFLVLRYIFALKIK